MRNLGESVNQSVSQSTSQQKLYIGVLFQFNSITFNNVGYLTYQSAEETWLCFP